MKLKKQLSILIICCLTLINCSDNKPTNISLKSDSDSSLKMVQLPSLINDPIKQREFIIAHFWDNYDFNDTSLIYNKKFTDNPFANYINILIEGKSATQFLSLESFINKTIISDKKISGKFFELFEHYLYDPNSPLRDEEIYIKFLECVIKSKDLLEIEKTRYRFQLELCFKNRVGTKASNFSFAKIDKSISSLYKVKGDFTVLLFYHPDCKACIEAINGIKNNFIFKSKSISIIAIFPENDSKKWRASLDIIPDEWLCGFDISNQIVTHNLYDLRPSPTIYLLDKTKNVLLKDAYWAQVASYLSDNIRY